MSESKLISVDKHTSTASFNDQGIISSLNDLKEVFKSVNSRPVAPSSPPVINITPELKLPDFHFPTPNVSVDPKIEIQPVITLGQNLIPIVKLYKLVVANLILLALVATINAALIIYIITK